MYLLIRLDRKYDLKNEFRMFDLHDRDCDNNIKLKNKENRQKKSHFWVCEGVQWGWKGEPHAPRKHI